MLTHLVSKIESRSGCFSSSTRLHAQLATSHQPAAAVQPETAAWISVANFRRFHDLKMSGLTFSSLLACAPKSSASLLNLLTLSLTSLAFLIQPSRLSL